MAAITGPAALIALAARLGIPKGAKIIAEKGFKYLQRLVTKAEKQVTKQQKTSGKKFTGEGSKRKQKTATQRKKPKVDSGLSIKKNPKKQRDWPDVKLTDRKERLTEKFLENHGYRHSDTPGKPDTYTYVGDKVKAYSAYVKGGKTGVSVKTFNNPTLKSLRDWMGY